MPRRFAFTFSVLRVRRPLVLCAAGLLLLGGCSAPTDSGRGVSVSLSDQPSAPAENESGDAVTIAMVDQAGYEAEIAKHSGKIVVVDFWATWCEPCKERFPHIVELSHQYSPDDVAFISVSFDLEGEEDKAVEFLTAQGAGTMTNLISSLPTADSFEAFDIHDGIPNYKIYDRNGELKFEFAQFANEEKQVLAADSLDIKLRELVTAGQE